MKTSFGCSKPHPRILQNLNQYRKVYIFEAILTISYTAWHFHSASPLGLKMLPKHEERNSTLVKALTQALCTAPNLVRGLK